MNMIAVRLLLLLLWFVAPIAALVGPKVTNRQTRTRPSTTSTFLYASVSNHKLPVENVTDSSSSTTTPNKDLHRLNVAVLLNQNARSVTSETADIARQVFGESAVFVTRSHDEARTAIATILQQRPKLIVPVGGDGTLTSCINDCVEYLQATAAVDNDDNNINNNKDRLTVNEAVPLLPVFGYIPLGTGNGVGSVVGCPVRGWRKRTRRRNLTRLLEQLRDYSRNSTMVVDLPMLHITTKTLRRLCFFAGIGFDSMMLDDFQSIKQWSRRTGLFRNLLSSVSGYCVALVLKTLPKAVQNKHNIQVRVESHDDDTLWIDHRRGDFVLPQKGTLFEGSTGILAAGTAPYYGGGLRLFPFARVTTNKMHLRIGRIHPMTGFFNIPGIFAGSYRDKSENFGVLDFLTNNVTVSIANEFPFQHSGESIGDIDNFRMQVLDTPVKFVSFLKQPRQADR